MRGGAASRAFSFFSSPFNPEPRAALFVFYESSRCCMSEYLEEAMWREHYRDLVGGVRLIREAVEEAFGPAAPLQATEYTASSNPRV
jgi:hypothetical protein